MTKYIFSTFNFLKSYIITINDKFNCSYWYLTIDKIWRLLSNVYTQNMNNLLKRV